MKEGVSVYCFWWRLYFFGLKRGIKVLSNIITLYYLRLSEFNIVETSRCLKVLI